MTVNAIVESTDMTKEYKPEVATLDPSNVTLAAAYVNLSETTTSKVNSADEQEKKSRALLKTYQLPQIL